MRPLLEPVDREGLLAAGAAAAHTVDDDMDDDALLAELGVSADTADIAELKHVRSSAEKRAADAIANREPCEDFDRFKPLFDAVREELDTGVRFARQIRKDAGFLKADVRAGDFFILGGQTAWVADIGEPFRAPNGQFDARLRIIYSNGTESNLLLRSLQRALYKDETSCRISDSGAPGPLFASGSGDDDLSSGTIYVLRSKSDHPLVSKHRDVVHKIGVTGGSVERRIANASKDPTFLLADVEVVAAYELHNIDRAGLENIIHRVFEAAKLDIAIMDRFGNPVTAREWFLVPLFVIDEVIERIRDGTIPQFVYDPKAAGLKKVR